MTKYQVLNIIITIILVILWTIEIFVTGIMVGRAKESDFQKQHNCQMKYSKVAQKDIPGECLKYFKIND